MLFLDRVINKASNWTVQRIRIPYVRTVYSKYMVINGLF